MTVAVTPLDGIHADMTLLHMTRTVSSMGPKIMTLVMVVTTGVSLAGYSAAVWAAGMAALMGETLGSELGVSSGKELAR